MRLKDSRKWTCTTRVHPTCLTISSMDNGFCPQDCSVAVKIGWFHSKAGVSMMRSPSLFDLVLSHGLPFLNRLLTIERLSHRRANLSTRTISTQQEYVYGQCPEIPNRAAVWHVRVAVWLVCSAEFHGGREISWVTTVLYIYINSPISWPRLDWSLMVQSFWYDIFYVILFPSNSLMCWGTFVILSNSGSVMPEDLEIVVCYGLYHGFSSIGSCFNLLLGVTWFLPPMQPQNDSWTMDFACSSRSWQCINSEVV